MEYPFYLGDGGQRRGTSPRELPVAPRVRFDDSKNYLADDGLRDAVNVALLLGQPLLLTGEPGTGKTQLAYSLAWELGFDEPLKFETKSSSAARDLVYSFDSLKRFQDAQAATSVPSPLKYLSYNALGVAILRACDESSCAHLLPEGFEHGGQRRSVVLVDEIDKAPRDFPNDLLNELEHMYFRVPELNNALISADPHWQPIVVITSNSEKDLPDAFLRRCIYYHIPFPDDEQLRQIVAGRLGIRSSGTSALLRDALAIFQRLRSPELALRKKPATAELLAWIRSLRSVSDADNPLQATPELALRTLSSLVKTAEDLDRSLHEVQSWINESSAGPA